MDWTPEKLSALGTDGLKSLRDNAAKKGVSDLVDLCDVELERRKPKKAPGVGAGSRTHSSNDVVIGFHFVCAKEQGVTRNPDGLIWTGTWVVALTHAERAAKIGSYVALHESKAEPSYLQGTIKGFRQSERERSYAEGQEVQTEYGIDFLFEPGDQPREWVGDGSGEKGYAWSSQPAGAS